MNNLANSLDKFELDELNLNSKISILNTSKFKKSLLVKNFLNKVDKKDFQNFNICIPINNNCNTGIYTLFFKAKSVKESLNNNYFRIIINSENNQSIILSKKLIEKNQLFRDSTKFYFNKYSFNKYLKIGVCFKDIFLLMKNIF